MNNVMVIFSACLCLSFTSRQTISSTNPINHVVAYESYTTMSLPDSKGNQKCLKNFYLYSNHLEKAIRVSYSLVGDKKSKAQIVILQPTIEKENKQGNKQTITNPEKIGETCDFKYEILEAVYIN